MDLIIDKRSGKTYIEFPSIKTTHTQGLMPGLIPKTPKSVRQHTFKNWNDKYEIALKDITTEFVDQFDEMFIQDHYIAYWNDAIENGLRKIIYDNSSSRWKSYHDFLT
jgi:hypothetical protein